MMKSVNPILLIAWLFLRILPSSYAADHEACKDPGLVFATYCLSYDQEKKASVLIDGIRELGGRFSRCPIYVVVHDTSRYRFDAIRKKNVILLQTSLPAEILNYPFAFKAFAAAQVEELVVGLDSGPDPGPRTLAWFDPETLLLAPPSELNLEGPYEAALRPVFLFNGVGIRADTVAGVYWGSVLQAAGVRESQLYPMETEVDEIPVKAYFNCGIFSVDPDLGVCRGWASILRRLIPDEKYQQTACTTPNHRIFLHQIAFTAAVIARVDPDRIHRLPVICGYPLALHERMPEQKKVSYLNELQCAITENLWVEEPNWTEAFRIDEPLASWLNKKYLDFLKVTDHVYRFESSCNSVLVTTPEGSVLIDPAGAQPARKWFREILNQHPLKAILLTHGHHDHRGDIAYWKGHFDIPVIAQEEYVEFIRYHDRLATFFAHRNKIWGFYSRDSAGRMKETPIEPTILYRDTFTFTLDGVHFRMIHVGGETPDQSVIMVPEYDLVLAGDNYYLSCPNLYTLRGTKPRWALEYIAAVDTMLAFEPSVVIQGHGSPLTEKRYARLHMKRYRDAIQYIHDETVKGINAGTDRYTLMNTITLPDSLFLHQFYGNIPWSVRGILEGYIGWFDETPESMYGMNPGSVYPDLLNLTGIDPFVELARQYLAGKEYRKALQITGILESAGRGSTESRNIRLQALSSLKNMSGNYIENIWLDHWIGEIR